MPVGDLESRSYPSVYLPLLWLDNEEDAIIWKLRQLGVASRSG